MICKVCKSYYKAKKENRYEVVESKGALSAIAAPARVFEAFDCPKCGCQNIVNVRESKRYTEPIKDEESEG
jgi:ssDNA-binding Zn-finger/Zn-ribbon topoisomerase 1